MYVRCNLCDRSSYCEGVARANCHKRGHSDFKARGSDLPGLTSGSVSSPSAPVAAIDVAWPRSLDWKLDEALAQPRTVFFETHELNMIQAALGGPYKSSGYFNSGLSSHEALQQKVDAELARRGRVKR